MAKTLPIAAALVASLGVSLPSHANVWLSGVDPVVLHDRDKNAADNDFMDLFKPVSSWPTASARVQVFKLSTQFLQRGTDEELATVVQYLRSHHIAVAWEAEIIVTSVKCGNGNPGFTTAAVIQKAANRLRSAGGELEYVAFDEPMAFRRAHKRPGQCGFNVDELVNNIAPNIRTIKTVFPNVVFGDIEPVTDVTAGSLAAIMEFAGTFQKQTGS